MNYQDRVKHEQVDLQSKIGLLNNFILTSEVFPTLDEKEQFRLNEQLSVMTEYNHILQDRINNFIN